MYRLRQDKSRAAAAGSAPDTAAESAADRHEAFASFMGSQNILLKVENPAELEQMRKALKDEYRPAGFHDFHLFETMLCAKWRLRRVQKMEGALPSIVPTVKNYKAHLKRMFNRARKQMLRERNRV